MRSLITVVFIIFLSSLVFGASVGLVPALVSFDFIPPGYTFDMAKKTGTPILIPNQNDFPVKYTISFEANKAPGQLLPGYENFPDVSWCKAIPETITVMANDTGKVNLVFTIPKDAKYLNQSWELGVIVQAKKGIEAESGGVKFGIFPSVRGSYLISTLPDIKINPKDKPTGIVPMAKFISLDEAITGKELSFKIFNNDTTAHDYTIEPYEFPHFEWYDVRLAIQTTGDNEPGDIKWLKVSKGFLFFKKNVVHIEPGQSAEWTVQVKLPDKKEIREAKGFDFVVKILPEGKKAHSGIFRIVIQNK